MKKTLVLFLALILFICSAISVSADNDTYVYVSIANGELKISYEKISVRDIDMDGEITINDALYCAHESKFEGGAEAGYEYSLGAFGLKIDKLWGANLGDSFGYYLNNASAMSLSDKVKNGDYVYAFCYTDLVNWSDIYSYFNVSSKSAFENEKINLSLVSSGFDASWNPITLAVKDAYITVNGKKTEVKTDENGNATLSFDKAGKYVISAVSSTENIVPPVCIVNISEKNETSTNPANPGDKSIALTIVILVSSVLVISTIMGKYRRA